MMDMAEHENARAQARRGREHRHTDAECATSVGETIFLLSVGGIVRLGVIGGN